MDTSSRLPGSGITLRELEILRTLVMTGTTIAAAEKLGITQPAISRAVAQMESRLDRKLFLRQGGRLAPTVEALAIDAEIDAVFEALVRIEDSARRAPDPNIPLRIGAPPTIAHRFLPGPTADFSRRYPDAPISVDVLSSDVLVTHVAEGRLDLALTDSEPSHAGVRVEPFRETRVVCLMLRDDTLAAKRVIVPKDIEGRDLVAQTRRHTVRVAKDRVLAAANVEPRITIEVATVVLAAELVLEGRGIALINPFPTALRLDRRLIMKPFEPAITMRTCFMSPAAIRHSAATLAFMALVRARADAITGDIPNANS
jgi:DNA-binding transcriptional LysR family regulator